MADSGNKRVVEYNSTSGSYLGTFNNSGNFSANLQYIHFDSGGYIWTSDYTHAKVQKFNSSGSLLTTVGPSVTGFGSIGSPDDFAIDGNNNL